MDSYLLSSPVRTTWIAFWVLWLYWIIYAILDTIFYRPEHYSGPGDTAAQGGQPAAGDTHRQGGGGLLSVGGKGHGMNVHRSQKILRDQVLALLSVLVVNTFGRGGSTSVQALTWIYIAFAIIWSAFHHGGAGHKVLDITMMIIQSCLLLAILIIAYASGWPHF